MSDACASNKVYRSNTYMYSLIMSDAHAVPSCIYHIGSSTNYVNKGGGEIVLQLTGKGKDIILQLGQYLIYKKIQGSSWLGVVHKVRHTLECIQGEQGHLNTFYLYIRNTDKRPVSGPRINLKGSHNAYTAVIY